MLQEGVGKPLSGHLTIALIGPRGQDRNFFPPRQNPLEQGEQGKNYALIRPHHVR
jgi:hypothetical protein